MVQERGSPRKRRLLREAKIGLRSPMKERKVAVNRLRSIP